MSNGDTESLIGSDSDYQSGVRIAQTILKKYKGRSHAQRIGRASRKSPSLNFSSYRIEDENSSSEDGNSSPRKEEKSKRKYDRFSRTNHYMQDEENDHDCFDSKYPIAHHDLYCQKSSSSSSSSREDNSSNYIALMSLKLKTLTD
ncbi:hypothetical protein SK128_027720 [Halocaridina rubra]|uniref:Uncharacterized protein n=1 Tax=Halocaridina rubra TaxID=373956 RepID=A0AAN8XML1_HALRR